MNRHRMRNRLPMPCSDHGRDIALSIWKRRHELTITMNPSSKWTTVDVRVTPALDIHVNNTGDSQIVTASRKSYSRHGSCYVSSMAPGVHFDEDSKLWVAHAVRAAQLARMLAELGLDDVVPDAAELCQREAGKNSRFAPLLRAVMPHRAPTTAEFLEERLDAEIMRRLAGMPITSTTSYRLEIGNGIVIDSAIYEPILAVWHDDHGAVTLPGLAASDLNRRTDELRLSLGRRLPSAAGPETARIARVLEICREAVRLDPEMTDASGTPILPLVESHLPRLAQRIEDAIRTSDRTERAAMGAEIDLALSSVASCVEEGMAIAARENGDALRRELGFLTMRHPARDVLLENVG